MCGFVFMVYGERFRLWSLEFNVEGSPTRVYGSSSGSRV